jgi:hypothetical protein
MLRMMNRPAQATHGHQLLGDCRRSMTMGLYQNSIVPAPVGLSMRNKQLGPIASASIAQPKAVCSTSASAPALSQVARSCVDLCEWRGMTMSNVC